MTLRNLVVTMVLVASGAVPVSAAAEAGQASSNAEHQRIERVELWLKAVLSHVPGTADAAAVKVASWQGEDMRVLWLDVNALVRLMRSPGATRFTWQTEDDSKPQEIRFTLAQLDRMRMLACAASGLVPESPCRSAGRRRELDHDLLELAVRVADSRGEDADNFVLRRGALLHTDIAVLSPAVPEAPSNAARSPIVSQFRVLAQDGRQTKLQERDDHWEIARGLLAYVRPPDSNRAAPERDDMVRRWYRATAAWMQDASDHETKHLASARKLFPADPRILFLSGCVHETFANPSTQSVREAAVLPAGITLAVAPEGRELRQAETFFRRSLDVDPAQPEAHLRLGHVLARLNRHVDAIRELREAVALTREDVLLYYASIFLGASLEKLGRYDEAQAAYEHAMTLYPMAQSPHLALSELARRRGNRGEALRAIQKVFELPWSQFERHDPWWDYHVTQARDVDEQLAELRRPFLPGLRP